MKTAGLSDKSSKFSFCPAENFSLSDKWPLQKSNFKLTDRFYEIKSLGIKLTVQLEGFFQFPTHPSGQTYLPPAIPLKAPLKHYL